MVTETEPANLNVLNTVVDDETCRVQAAAFFQGPVITQLKAQIPRASFPLTNKFDEIPWEYDWCI
jgi:hypothetical protein